MRNILLIVLLLFPVITYAGQNVTGNLGVTGTTTTVGFKLTTNPASGYFLQSDSTGIGTWVTAPSSSATPGGSSPQLQFNSSSSFGGVSGSGVDSNGNVGIGSAVPGTILDVVGTLRVSSIGSINTNVGIGTFNIIAFGKAGSFGNIKATAPGSIALGRATGTTVANENNIFSNNEGSIAAGYTNSTTISAQHSAGVISTSAAGAVALGAAFGDQTDPNTNTATLSATNNGSFAQGHVQAVNTNGASIAWLGLLTATGKGCMGHGYSVGGTIQCTGNGGFTTGYAHLGSGSGASPTIQSSGNGAVAFGDASVHDSTILASGTGSLAGGTATTTLQATGSGSVALGTNVQATQNSAMAFGTSIVNNIASSFQIGYSTAKPTFYADITNVGIGTDMVGASGKLIVMGGNIGLGTISPSGNIDYGTTNTWQWPAQKATTGTRYLCIDTVGRVTSSASACSGT